jgi:hypothetical protein
MVELHGTEPHQTGKALCHEEASAPPSLLVLVQL